MNTLPVTVTIPAWSGDPDTHAPRFHGSRIYLTARDAYATAKNLAASTGRRHKVHRSHGVWFVREVGA